MNRKVIERIVCVSFLSVGLLFGVGTYTAKADVVTDTLAVRVGYSGMALSDYVEVGKYHWSKLYNDLPIVSNAYSYYQKGTGKKFTAVVDSANGFLIEDLLDYAKVYYGDIYNLKFYVEDHKGIQTSFDRDTLFAKRYYFRDYNYNARYYDKNGKEVIDPERCWNDCIEVRPILALEDNWASFTEEFEHADSDFNYMSAGNRFRLLFGQTRPQETLTQASAKYVSCVYITLYGKPEIGKTPKLDGSYGSHKVTMTVKADNESIRNALSELLKLKSTNENVMVIRGYTVKADDFYSDVAHVTINYEIVGKGDASISASVGGVKIEGKSGSDSMSVSVKQDKPGSNSGNGSGKNNSGNSGASENTGKDTKDLQNSATDGKNENNPSKNEKNSSESGKNPSGSNTSSKSEQTKKEDVESKKTGSDTEQTKNQTKSDAKKANNEQTKAQRAESVAASAAGYALTGNAADQLEEQLAQVQEILPADQNITEVKTKENTDKNQKKRILWIALASLGICVAGGLFESVWFWLKRR